VSFESVLVSTSFDSKLRLDIGLSEFMSSGFSVGFFNRVSTTAAIRFAQKTPSWNDALQIFASVSAAGSNVSTKRSFTISYNTIKV